MRFLNQFFDRLNSVLFWIVVTVFLVSGTYLRLHHISHFDASPINGTFQLYNALHRLDIGQYVGKDFFYFHGSGILLVHYPIYALLGKTVFAAEASKYFTIWLAQLILVVLVAIFWIQEPKRRMQFVLFLYAAEAFFLWGGELILELMFKFYGFNQVFFEQVSTVRDRIYELFIPVNSLNGTRGFMLWLLAIPVAFVPKRWLPWYIGASTGAIVWFSADFGLVLPIVLTIFLGLYWFLSRPNLKDMSLFLLSALVASAIALVGLAFVSTGFSLTGIRSFYGYNYAALPSFQNFYFSAPPVDVVDGFDYLFQYYFTKVEFLALIGLLLYFGIIWLREQKKTTVEKQVLFLLCLFAIIHLLIISLSILVPYYFTNIIRTILFVGGLLLVQKAYSEYVVTGLSALILIIQFGAVAFYAHQDVVASAYSHHGVRLSVSDKNKYHQQFFDRQSDWKRYMSCFDVNGWTNSGLKIHSMYATLGPVLVKPKVAQPFPDYIIHALGAEYYPRYLSDVKSYNPDIIELHSGRYSTYASWLQSNHYDYYNYVLDNYRLKDTIFVSSFLVKGVGYPTTIWHKLTVKDNQVALPLLPADTAVLEYKMVYHVEQRPQIPAFNKYTRFILKFSKTSMPYDQLFNPMDSVRTGCVFLKAGEMGRLYTSALNPLLPFVEGKVDIKRFEYRFRTLDKAMFRELYQSKR